MLAEITPQEYREWKALDQVEPFGDEWRQTALIVTSIKDAIEQYLELKTTPEGKAIKSIPPSSPFNWMPIPVWLRKRLNKQWQS